MPTTSAFVARFGVLLILFCVLAVQGSAAVSLEDIFQAQATGASTLDNSCYTLVVEGEIYAEDGIDQTRSVYSIESSDGVTLNQCETYASGTRAVLEDGSAHPAQHDLLNTPTVAASRVLQDPARTLVWTDVTRPQLQVYYTDDWAQVAIDRKLERHLRVYLPPAPSAVAFGGGVNEGVLEAYYHSVQSRLAGTSESIAWDVIPGPAGQTALVEIVGRIDGAPYMRIKLDPALGYRVVEAEAGLAEGSFARDVWTKTYQNIDGVWFPHVLTQVRRDETGEVRERIIWSYSNVRVSDKQPASDGDWLEKMNLPERALVQRVYPADWDGQQTEYELVAGEFRPIENLQTMVADLNLTR